MSPALYSLFRLLNPKGIFHKETGNSMDLIFACKFTIPENFTGEVKEIEAGK